MIINRYMLKRFRALLVLLTTVFAILLNFNVKYAYSQNAPALPIPRVTSLFPVGGQIGKSITVTILGSELAEPSAIIFSHPGLTGDIASEATTPAKSDAKGKQTQRPVSNPGMLTAKITVGKDVPIGLYDLRVVTRLGISNPRFFSVGPYAEMNEHEKNNDVNEAEWLKVFPQGLTVNGTISTPTDVDYFAFRGKKGQKVAVFCAASSIESRAKPALELYDLKRHQLLAENRNDRGNDAAIAAELPDDGIYYLRICEFAYQFGSADSFYRLTICDGPIVDAVFPPVNQNQFKHELTLRNGGSGNSGHAFEKVLIDDYKQSQLPFVKMKWDSLIGLQEGADFQRLNHVNQLPMLTPRETVVVEADKPHQTFKTAQQIETPIELWGRLGPSLVNEKKTLTTADWYHFRAKKGQKLFIDLAAERIGSNMDTYMSILNSKQKEIVSEAQLDDDTDNLHPLIFFSRSLDPPGYLFNVPEDDDYFVQIATRDEIKSDAHRKIYRLRIAPPRPDFKAIVMARHKEQPMSVVVMPESTVAVDLLLHRIDGYQLPVIATAKNLPKGVTAEPALIGYGQKTAAIILKGEKELAIQNSTFEIEVKSVDGKITHTALPATITWGVQQNSNNPTMTRLDQTFPISTRHFYAPPTFELSNADETHKKVIDFKPGEKVTLPIRAEFNVPVGDRPAVTLGIETTHHENQKQPFINRNQNNQISIPKDKQEGTVVLEINSNALPGRYRALIRGDAQYAVPRSDDKNKKTNTTISAWLETKFRVLPSKLVVMSASPANVKQALAGEVKLSVVRLHGFEGEIEIEIKWPNERGLSSEKAVVAKGQSEVSIPIKCAANAKLGRVQNIPVVVRTVYDGDYPVVQEERITVNVEKP